MPTGDPYSPYDLSELENLQRGYAQGQHSHPIHTQTPTWATIDNAYEEDFKKIIILLLGSKEVPQDLKDELINRCLPISNFRKYVKSYFPDYASKIELWEKLHSGQTD